MAYEAHRRKTIRNGILGNLAVADLACISPYLQPVAMKERVVLHEPKKRIEYVHFIESGLVSLRTLTTGSILETAMVGYRGVVGASIVLGTETSIHHSIVLVAGSALRIRVSDLHRLMIERPLIRDRLLQHVQALMIQGAQTALCGVRHELGQRLACWLSIACDALDGDALPITHDQLSIILGLPRAGLTKSLIRFEEEGLVRKTRGFIQVLERNHLRRKACGCYGVIAGTEYPERPSGALEALDESHATLNGVAPPSCGACPTNVE